MDVYRSPQKGPHGHQRTEQAGTGRARTAAIHVAHPMPPCSCMCIQSGGGIWALEFGEYK